MPTLTSGTHTAAPKATPLPETWQPMPNGANWIVFAGIMFLVSATLNTIWGIAAVSNSHFFVGDASLILSGLNTWGWVAMGFAALEVLAALSIFRGGTFGRWFGIIVAGFAVVAAMMSIPAYPLWSLALVALGVMVIHGLAAHGGKPEPSM